MTHRSDSNYYEGATLSLSPPMCQATDTVLFFLLVNILLTSLLSGSMWKFISIQLMGQDLVTGPQWSSGQESVISLQLPDLSLWLGMEILLQVTAGRGL